MKHKTRWLWLVLAACLLITQIPAIAADDVPSKLTIELRRVEGERAVEVSLLVTAGERFTQAEAVLEYDPGYVKPAGTTVDTAADWSTAVTAQTTAPGQVSGKPSLVYETAADGADTETPAAAKGYLYLGAELMRAAQPSEETQLVTVRFELTDAAAAAAEDAAYLKEWFKLASQDACTGSPVGCAAQVIAGATYDYVPEGTEQPLYTQRLALPTWTTLTGPSLSGGGAASTPSTDDFCSVVFYDWDGTLLGTRLVAKGGSLTGDSAETADQRGDGATQAPLPPEGNLLYDVDGDGVYDPDDGDVKNKEGYDFVGWVDYYTGNSTPDVSNAANEQAHHSAEELISLANISKNLVVKAAYDENGSIYETGSNESTIMDRFYEVTYDPFQPTEDYSALYTTFHIKRLETTRRAHSGELNLTLVLQPNGAGQTSVSVGIGNADYVAYTFNMPWGADAVYDPMAAVGFYITDKDGNSISDASAAISAAEITG